MAQQYYEEEEDENEQAQVKEEDEGYEGKYQSLKRIIKNLKFITFS